MVKQIKSPSCGPSWCEYHVFELNPLKSGLHFKKKLKLRLCPKHNKGYNTFDKALPVINCDKKHYTPLFVLEEDKKFYSEHDERAQANHEKLIEKEQQDQSYFTIYQPKHGGEKPYCSVCQKAYFEYMDHINSHDHKKNLQNTIFTRYIMQIQQNFKKSQKEPNAPVISPQQISPNHLSNSQTAKMDTKQKRLLQDDFQTIKSINLTQKPMGTLDKLQMQHIHSHYLDTSSLKDLEELV